jgi:hypothetical protein
VIIEAEVLTRSNRVELESIDFNRQHLIHITSIGEQEDRKTAAVKSIDSRNDAIYFSPKKTRVTWLNDGHVGFAVTGTFAFQDKWKADYKHLREQFGYFNLPSFEPESVIRIRGYDASKREIFRTSFVYDGTWKLWGIKSYGATRTMEVHPNETEEVKVKFRVPLNKLDEIKTFQVDLI